MLINRVPKSCKILNTAVVVAVDMAPLFSISFTRTPSPAVILSLLTINTFSVPGMSYTIFVFPSTISSPILTPAVTPVGRITIRKFTPSTLGSVINFVRTQLDNNNNCHYRYSGVGPFLLFRSGEHVARGVISGQRNPFG